MMNSAPAKVSMASIWQGDPKGLSCDLSSQQAKIPCKHMHELERETFSVWWMNEIKRLLAEGA